MALRVAVLCSGRGTNLEALLAARAAGDLDLDVALVLVNKEGVGAIDIARAHGVPLAIVPSKGAGRADHESRVVERLDEVAVDLVVLAGYMRVLTPGFIQRYQGRLINIHPSLLPAFPGVDAPTQAWQAGVRIAGCTTHFVTEEVDGGPIIAQAAVALPPGLEPREAADRILAAEHRLYVHTLRLLNAGQVSWQRDQVIIAPEARDHLALFVEVDA